MRILLAHNLPYAATHAGSAKANRALMEGLVSRGHQAWVVAPIPRGLAVTDLEQSGFQVMEQTEERVSGKLNGVEVHLVRREDQPAAFSKLFDEVAAQVEAELLLVFSFPRASWIPKGFRSPDLLKQALEMKTPRTAMLVHSVYDFPFGPHRVLEEQVDASPLAGMGLRVTCSRYQQQYLREHGALSSEVMPYPAFQPVSANWRSSGPYVTLINPCALKGIDIFLELARRLPEVRFAAVPTWGTTPAEIDALKALSNITLLKAQNDIDRIFEQTRILLMPSVIPEGFPLSPVEAMLRGIPVIASDAGGLPEAMLGVPHVLPVRQISQYIRGQPQVMPPPVIPPQETEPWVQTLAQLLSDSVLYRRISNEARARAAHFVTSVATIEHCESILLRNEAWARQGLV